jgi:erythrin-vacuolar iron transport family protein
MKNFSDLTEQELLALAISLEEEDSRIYDEFAHELDENYPDMLAKKADAKRK